jgi:hypothetical protein
MRAKSGVDFQIWPDGWPKKEIAMQKRHGEITGAVGSQLTSDLWAQGYGVMYDHGTGGGENVGVTSAWIGDEKKKDNRLAEIDVVIYARKERNAVLLVEIEESGDNPKKIIGAALATLLADNIASSGKENFPIGDWTTLLIAARGEGEAHIARTKEIESRISQLAGAPGVNKMGIGKTRLALFQNQDDLLTTIMEYL